MEKPLGYIQVGFFFQFNIPGVSTFFSIGKTRRKKLKDLIRKNPSVKKKMTKKKIAFKKKIFHKLHNYNRSKHFGIFLTLNR